jgi:poly(A) polymerase
MLDIKNSLPYASELCQLLTNNGGETRLVGGSVRDLIIGREISDIDLATNLTPDQVQQTLDKYNIQYHTIGKAFGTISALYNNNIIEVTTLRKDLSCNGRHAEVEFTNNWKEDAKRRDFTINALSVDLSGIVYDYYDGLSDLKQGKVRFIGNPEDRILEDHLRILRFFRFSAYFAKTLDTAGLNAAIKYKEKLSTISGNRIKHELSKLIVAPNGSDIIQIMQQHNILNLSQINTKALKKLDRISNTLNYIPSALLRFAILLKHHKEGTLTIKSLAFTRQEETLLDTLIKASIDDWSQQGLKQSLRQYKDLFQQVVLINLSFNKSDQDYLLTSGLKKLFFHPIHKLPINGDDFVKLGIEPGKAIGKLLMVADQIWYDQEFAITKDQLLKKTLSYVDKL